MIHSVSKLSSIVQYTKCKATSISKALAESTLYKQKHLYPSSTHTNNKTRTYKYLCINNKQCNISLRLHIAVMSQSVLKGND